MARRRCAPWGSVISARCDGCADLLFGPRRLRRLALRPASALRALLVGPRRRFAPCSSAIRQLRLLKSAAEGRRGPKSERSDAG